jgi:type IV secretory pathway VirB2 component (pilin)
VPTPDPTLIAEAIGDLAAIFTGNYTTILTAVVALVGIITIPVLVIRGGLSWAVGGVKRLFKRT